MCTAAGQCTTSSTARWDVGFTTATIGEHDETGSAWDPFGGLPDPFACATVSGTSQCTNYFNDTLRPEWDTAVFTGVTTAALQGGMTVAVYDYDDGSPDDWICGVVNWIPTDADFRAGGRTFTCATNGSSFTVRLIGQ